MKPPQDASDRHGVKFEQIIIAPLSNDYGDYLTTFEEYQAQRYEAASTVFGPNTLKALIFQMQRLLSDLMTGFERKSESLPKYEISRKFSLIPGVILDSPYPGRKDGYVIKDAAEKYLVGQTVAVEFNGANPRNLQKDSFLTVEKWSDISNSWLFHDDDSSWYTKVHWRR